MEQPFVERSLLPLAFRPFRLGEIRPEGWLADQLRIQADSLTGKLDEFWPDVAESGWIGGSAEGWERGPYWLDGLIPLAFLLDDDRLKSKAKRWMDYIIEHQHDDGWLGPVRSPEGRYQAYDPWPCFVILKAMIQYYEATGDERIPQSILRFLRRLDALLDEKPLFDWGKSRWADLVLSIHWMYRRLGEPWLLDLAAKARAQGFDWMAHFAAFTLTQKTPRERASQVSHVVNNAMAIKAAGVWYVQSHDERDLRSVYRMIETLDRYHGQVTGIFSGDEHLAGKSPSQGAELCAVVEYMFSLEVLISLLGDPAFGDRLERIAFNALPGTFTPDMWAHQYDQQANQVECVVGKHVWTTNNDDANIFGLEPNFGCCTANLHQGWPKFASHLWMGTPDGGVAAVAYAPSRVRTQVRGGRDVTIRQETEYPFGETVRLTIDVDEPAVFPVVLRIPAWARGAHVVAQGEAIEADPGTFLTVEKRWQRGDALELTLPMEVVAERRFNDAVALSRGPLVFSLAIDEEFKEIKAFGPAKDFEIRAKSPWNYGLEIDAERPQAGVEVVTAAVSKTPFDPKAPPVSLRVKARRVPEWTMEPGFHDAAPPPASPVVSNQPAESIELIPYGAAHLRITEFPVIARDEEIG